MQGHRLGAHLLQRGYKGLKLCKGVLSEEQARKGAVEGGAVACIGGDPQEGELLGGMVAHDEVDGLQLEHQLATHEP